MSGEEIKQLVRKAQELDDDDLETLIGALKDLEYYREHPEEFKGIEEMFGSHDLIDTAE